MSPAKSVVTSPDSTWLGISPADPFGLATLPYGVFVTASDPTVRVGVRIGDWVVDLAAVTRRLAPRYSALVEGGSLDALLGAGREAWDDVRAMITSWFTSEKHRDRVTPHLVPIAEAVMRLPFTVADFVDFYASEQHATNLGRIFRPDQEPLTANWQHLPIGYHGRAGTIVVSGTEVWRPWGQRRTPEGEIVFAASCRLDFEAELGFVVGTPSAPGTAVALEDFADHVFGVCLVNDWSARDLQHWEGVPLGPLLGKSFATSVSAWIVPLAALHAATVRPPKRAMPLLNYLDDTGREPWGLDVRLEVRLNGNVLSNPPYADMYWTAAQMLAHMTANGAPLRTGDLYASGTVSGSRPDELGSLIELSRGGSRPVVLPDGSTRVFLADGDEVVITAVAPGGDGAVIGFGEVRGRIAPLHPGS